MRRKISLTLDCQHAAAELRRNSIARILHLMQRFSSILRPIRLLLLPAFGLLMPACEEAVRDVLKAKRTKELREIYQVGIDAIDANYPYGVEVQPPMSGCDSLEYPGPPSRVIYDTMLGGDWGG